MLIGKKLSDQYWQFASAYACKVYNNIPPSHTPKIETLRSSHEKFYETESDASMFTGFTLDKVVLLNVTVHMYILLVRSV